MIETTTKPPRIDRHQALEMYLRLGPERSLSKLHQRLTNISPEAPSLDMFKYWSARYAWQKTAAKHTASVAAKVAGKLERAEVKERFDQVAEFTEIIEEGAQALKDWISDPANLKKIANASEFGTVANSLVRLSQLVELLSGRSTGRLDSTHAHPLEPPDWMKERLAQARCVNGDDGMGPVIDHQPVKPKRLN